MITAPLLQYGVKVDLPESSRNSLEVSKDQVVLSITKERTILIDRYKVTLPGLADKLRAVFKRLGRPLLRIVAQAFTRSTPMFQSVL